MNTKSPTPNRAETEAGEWAALLNQQLVSIDRHNEFDTWLKLDPEHARAYESGKEVLQVAGSCADLLEEARAEEAAASEARRNQLKLIAVAASMVLAVSAVFLGAREFSLFGLGTEFETVTAQVKDIQLDDGTLVTLGAASQIEVDFGQHERRVKLTRGEAFFEVTRDTRRPFVVSAGNTVVRVLGTKFNVHYGEQAVRVGVVEGRVEVVRAAEPKATAAKPELAPRQVLAAGHTAVATSAGTILTSIEANHEDLGAWRQGRLVYVDARLQDIVSDMNRYFDGEIRLANEALGERQLTITFRCDEIDQGLDLIESALPVRAMRTEPRKVVLAER